MRYKRQDDLEAFPVHDGWARLVVLLLGDPHLLEGGQGGQDGPSDPDGVPANVQREHYQVRYHNRKT